MKVKRPLLASVLVVAGLLVHPLRASADDSGAATDASSQAATLKQYSQAVVNETVVAGNAPVKGLTKAAAAVAATWSFDVTASRGSFLLGNETRIQGATNLSTISWTYATQKVRYVFPNTAQNKGITKYRNTSTDQRWESKFTLGAGTVTPWGSVNIYSWDDSQWGQVTPTSASAWN